MTNAPLTDQQGDVRLTQTSGAGEIVVVGGVVEMTAGLETSAYLSLFGGNDDDDGTQESNLQWWGNTDELDPAKKYRAETQFLINGLPTTSANLLLIEQAANRDLGWMLTEGVASSVDIVATIPTLNRLDITVTITAEGDESTFKFSQNWKASV